MLAERAAHQVSVERDRRNESDRLPQFCFDGTLEGRFGVNGGEDSIPQPNLLFQDLATANRDQNHGEHDKNVHDG